MALELSIQSGASVPDAANELKKTKYVVYSYFRSPVMRGIMSECGIEPGPFKSENERKRDLEEVLAMRKTSRAYSTSGKKGCEYL